MVKHQQKVENFLKNYQKKQNQLKTQRHILEIQILLHKKLDDYQNLMIKELNHQQHQEHNKND